MDLERGVSIKQQKRIFMFRVLCECFPKTFRDELDCVVRASVTIPDVAFTCGYFSAPPILIGRLPLSNPGRTGVGVAVDLTWD